MYHFKRGVRKITLFLIICFSFALFGASSVIGWSSLMSELDSTVKANTYSHMEIEYYKSLIPEDYFDLFWYYTKDFPELRPEIYAIMKWESGNFRRKGYGPINKNGSYDYGFMQINTVNLKNPYFVNKYSAKDKKFIRNYHDETIVMGINFFKELHDIYGENAFACYNGGPKADRILKYPERYKDKYNRFIKTVSFYQKSVKQIARTVNIDLSVIKNDVYMESETTTYMFAFVKLTKK